LLIRRVRKKKEKKKKEEGRLEKNDSISFYNPRGEGEKNERPTFTLVDIPLPIFHFGRRLNL